jgi:Purine nucleoside phosphorylase
MKFKNAVLTVFGGVGYNHSELGKPQKIKTDYGDVSYSVFQTENGSKIIFISRHQGKYHVPPHEINYLSLIQAAQKIGAPILSMNSVGLMRPVLLTSSFDNPALSKYSADSEKLKISGCADFDNFSSYPFFIPNDFIDFTKNRVNTFYSRQTVHTDMSDPYCLSIRTLLKTVLFRKNLSFSEGIYICTEGPRFETKAEIKMFSNFADVVGMTGVPEVVLAKEAGLCYASLCIITNPAAGLCKNTLTADEIKTEVSQAQQNVFSILSELADLLFEMKQKQKETDADSFQKCRCKNAAADGKL